MPRANPWPSGQTQRVQHRPQPQAMQCLACVSVQALPCIRTFCSSRNTAQRDTNHGATRNWWTFQCLTASDNPANEMAKCGLATVPARVSVLKRRSKLHELLPASSAAKPDVAAFPRRAQTG